MSSRFTLDDLLPRQILEDVSELSLVNPNLKIVVVGGFATQLYSPSPQLYRPTIDLDLMICEETEDKFSERMSYNEFKNRIGVVLAKKLEDNGHPTTFEKPRFGFEIKTQDENDLFFVHFSRFSEAYFQRHIDWKKREFDNAKPIKIPNSDHYVTTHRIEDIFANKTRRLARLNHEGYTDSKDREDFSAFLDERFDLLATQDLPKRLGLLVSSRKPLLAKDPKNSPELMAYKVKKDLYDVALLSRAVVEGKEPLDINYLRTALSTISLVSNGKKVD